jgi:MoaA/NifB/PqqE/SkfB family radical SAM enzyme
MRNVLFGITTKCPLKCEHCYEWDNLNVKERLSFSDLQLIIEKLVNYGVGQIHFGGGEPMMRFEDVLKLVELYRDRVGFWLITSGFQLTEVRARQLKEAGLTGVCISIDHHVEELHNEFRKYPQSFQIAQEAVHASNKAGLVTSLSLCTTKEFTHKKNLETYVSMGRNLGVSFIQFLEPRAVGHYNGKDVKLSSEQKSVLEEVFLKVNTEVVHRQDPMIIYHEYYLPTMGCRGAGNGTIYIDPLGQVHACPFCRKSVGNIVTDSVENCVDRLREKGCASPVITSINQKVQTLETIEG